MDYRLGPWLVRPALNSVERGDEVVHVTPKAMQVLTLLAEHAPEVVRKEEIFEQIWPGTFVTDDALTRCIGELRKAFHDEAQEPTVIKTVPRRGYFVVAEVRPAQAAGAAVPAHRSRRAWAMAAGIVTVAGLAGFAALSWPAKHTDIGHIRRIAVLPLIDLSAPPRNEYFADSVTDELIGQVAHIARWQVISMTSVMRYKGAKEPLRKIAADLDVEGIIEGTIQRVDNKVRITAQLIDARADTHLWSGRFEREMGDLLSLQSSIARSIADELHIKLSADEQKRLAGSPKVKPEAYEEYLKGMHCLRKTEYAKAAEAFDKATRLDRDYGIAYALLAESASMASGVDNMSRTETIEAAIKNAQRLAPDLAETRMLVASRTFFRDRNWSEGLDQFRLAAERDPASVRVALRYTTALETLRHWDEAERECLRALKLDPLNYATRMTMGRVYLDAGRLDHAAAEFQKAIELEPQQFAYWRLGNIREAQGKDQEAIGWYIKAHSIPKEEFRREPLVTALKTGGLNAYWRKRAELELLDTQGKASRPTLAVSYIQLGEMSKALDVLEQCYQERPDSLAPIYSNFHTNKLRGQPRFDALLHKLNFPPGQH